MSYCSENKLPLSTHINRLIEVVELLGYIRVRDDLKIENEIASFLWLGNDQEISFVEVELSIYREQEYISVQTRTRAGRSYWDLEKQNKTISLINSLFNGSFNTDVGKNRYMKIDGKMPSRLSCALYKARWIYNNQMIKPLLYLDNRNMTGESCQDKPIGISWIDEYNSRFLSNNMLLPYIIGCWEAYYRNSYISILKYTKDISEQAIKNCRAGSNELLSVIRGQDDLTSILADSLSFQRPGIIAENFRRLNAKIDIASWLRKPYHNRKTTLFDSISLLIDTRDNLVHTGEISLDLQDKRIRQVIKDLRAAVDRVYEGLGQIYGFKPSYYF